MELYLNNSRNSPEGREAINRLLTRYRDAIYATALRKIHDPEAADEVAQAVMVHTLGKLQQLRDPRSFGGWVRVMTTRMASNHLMRGKKPWDAGDATEAIPDREMEDPLLVQERRELLAECLDELKELDRQVLEAFYLEDLSLKETALKLGAPIGTIKRRLHEARNHLKDVIAERRLVSELV